MLLGLALLLHQFLKMADSFRSQEGVRTHITYFGRDIFEDNHIRTPFDGMNDEPMFVSPGTTLDTALHCLLPLCKGVTHLGGFGSYTVIMIAMSSHVVQTICKDLPVPVSPRTRQQAPRW
jgi:hypothetical protein